MKKQLTTAIVIISLLAACAPTQQQQYISPAKRTAMQQCDYEVESMLIGKPLGQWIVLKPQFMRRCLSAKGF